MKNNKTFLFLIIFSLFFSCQKEENNIVKTLEFDGMAMLTSNLLKNPDGYVMLEFDEYIDDNSESVSAMFASGFKDNGTLVDAGIVNIKQIYSLEKLVDNRFLLSPKVNKQDFYGKTISTSFTSVSSIYANFASTIYVPKQMNVKSNIGTGDYFHKTENIVFTWTPDVNTSLVYIGICAEGVPCIFKQVPDNGSYTVSNNEFVNFPVGGKVFIHIGRGTLTCIENGQKEICIAAFNNARTPGHIIQ